MKTYRYGYLHIYHYKIFENLMKIKSDNKDITKLFKFKLRVFPQN